MSRAGDRQELGDALDNAEEDSIEDIVFDDAAPVLAEHFANKFKDYENRAQGHADERPQ